MGSTITAYYTIHISTHLVFGPSLTLAPLQLYYSSMLVVQNGGALSLALRESKMVALSESNDGHRSYNSIDTKNVIPGTDVETWLPRTTWKQDDNSGLPCQICLNVISEGDQVSQFSCSHPLHFECAKTWMTSCICKGQAGRCPTCNFVVVVPVFEKAYT